MRKDIDKFYTLTEYEDWTREITLTGRHKVDKAVKVSITALFSEVERENIIMHWWHDMDLADIIWMLDK